MSAVSLIAVGQDARKTAPYSLASMTGTVYDSSGVSYIVPTPIISLVFFRGKTFIPPIPAIPANLVFLDVGSTLNLTWEVSQYATSYTVNFYRNTVNNLTTGSIYETVTTSATSVTSTMSTSTIYFYYATIFSSNFARDSATVKTEYAISYSSGAVTIAGKPGVSGTANGFGEENLYFVPLFGSIDPSGNLYITSGYAHIIQRLTIPGYQGSTFSTSANITHPRGSVVYNGYLYVCDGGPSLPLGSIKKMPLSGGTATTLASGLTNPVYIAIDGAGGFYVSTQQYDIIYRISSGGTVSQRNISGYNGITGIAYHPPTGYIYFTNTATGSTTSSFARVAEGSSSAELIQGNIDFSVGVKMNHDNTAVYYSVTNDNTIRKYVIATGAIIAIIGSVNDNSYVDSLTLANVRINNCYDIIVMNNGLGMYVLDQGAAAQTVRKVIFGDEPPPAPTNVQLVYTIGDPTMTVTYVAVTGATSYTGQFYLNTTETTTGATSIQGPTTLATTSFTSTFTIVRNRYYYAVVKSFNAIGSSSNRTGFTYSGLDSPTGVAMAAYTSGATSISVSWNSVEGAASYTVNFYASGNATPVQTFASVTSLSQASSFTLVTNTTYYASVRANNSIASSTFQQSSNNITTAPSSPTGVTMGAYTAGATSISVSWNSVSGATSYTVNFYASGNATPVQTFASVTSLSQASSFTLVENTTYYASVRANNATTSSPFQQSSNNITTAPPEAIVTTLAGSAFGFADGTGADALFAGPLGVAVDSTGVIVADRGNHRIRKVTNPGGAVTTLAGSGAAGFADGTGAGASFHSPSDVTVNSSGDVIVADLYNRRIRKVTNPGGVVTTLAGGDPFWHPSGVAVDSTDNVIVADQGSHCIFKITPGGVVTTLAGSGAAGFADGTGAGASFHSPSDVTVDSSGDVIVADSINNRIRKVTPGGVVTTLAGDGFGAPNTGRWVDGSGSGASFWSPSGVAMDVLGNVIVSDSYNQRIRKVTPPNVPACMIV